MSGSAQKGLLGNYRMAPHLYGGDGVQPYIVADGGKIAYFYAPGVMDPGSGANDNVFPEFAAKPSQEPAPKTVTGYGRKAEKGVLHQKPQKNRKLGPAIGETGIIPMV
jgi:hypothetical protein